MTVKLTDAQLKQIIREEVEASIDEGVMDTLKNPFSTIAGAAAKPLARSKEAAKAGMKAAAKSWRGGGDEEGGPSKEDIEQRKEIEDLINKCRTGSRASCAQIVTLCRDSQGKNQMACQACAKDKYEKCTRSPVGAIRTGQQLKQMVAKCHAGNQEACGQCPEGSESKFDMKCTTGKGCCRGKFPEQAAAAGEAPAAAPGEAAKEPAAAKNNVYIFKGKGGKGVQSQMSRAGIKGQDMSRLMKGLKTDLTAAGFNVMQEAGRRQIALTNTLAALEQIADPAQKEAVKKILVQVLRSNQVKVHPQHSRALAPSRGVPAKEDPTPEDTEAAAKAPNKGEMFNYVSGKGAKAVVVVTDPLEKAPDAAQVSKVNPETCKASTSRVFAAPVSKLADPVDKCVPKQGAPKKGQTFNYVSGKGNKSTVIVVDTLDKDPKTVQVAKVNPETCKASTSRVFAVAAAKLTDRAAKCVPGGIKESTGDMKALMENWNKFLENEIPRDEHTDRIERILDDAFGLKEKGFVLEIDIQLPGEQYNVMTRGGLGELGRIIGAGHGDWRATMKAEEVLKANGYNVDVGPDGLTAWIPRDIE